MKKVLCMFGLAAAMFSANAMSDELYADGGFGISEAEAGPWETDDTYFRIGGGIQLLDNVSAEAGFWDLGSDTDRGVKISADALYAALRAHTEIGYNLVLFGRFGLMHWEADVGNDDDDGHDLFFGGGIGYPAGPGLVSFELHFVDLDDIDITAYGISYTLPISF